MGLAFGGAGADRAPGDRVGDVLRGDRIEELATDRQAEIENLEQQLTGQPQTAVDVAGPVQMRVVDQALPAGRRPWLLEIDAHRDQQVAELEGELSEPLGVLVRRVDVVDAAGPDDHQQSMVHAVEDPGYLVAAVEDVLDPLRRERVLVQQQRRGGEGNDLLDSPIANRLDVAEGVRSDRRKIGTWGASGAVPSA